MMSNFKTDLEKEIIEILKTDFRDVYCDTCGSDKCEGCYRKNMNWSISENFAKIVAKEIIKKIKEGEY